MKSEYKIIDNVLSPEQFTDLTNFISGNAFPWYFNDTVAFESDEVAEKNQSGVITESQQTYNFYYTHMVFDSEVSQELIDNPNPELWQKILPILYVTDMREVLRCKINNYLKTPTIIHHQQHTDYDYKHKGALFYLNTNDGLTVLEDGTEIESVANRLLLFDASIPHHSTTTSNQDRRLNINFNYF